MNFSHITHTENVLWGQPRLQGRRLCVGDVVSLVSVNDSPDSVQEDYELTKEQILQVLHYCATQQCLQDKPIRFCHNCTFRTTQENEPIEDEKDNWLVAAGLLNTWF